jgi:WD40 repeat protein/transcriptional regulator with XRE-family HTH domain
MASDEIFRDRLKQWRKALDLTQAELAHKASCSIYTLQHIEEGVARPSRQLAELLAVALEIPPEERATFVRRARGVEDQPGAGGSPTTAATPGNGSGTASTEPAIANPYKGLRAFGEADAPDFFGREALTWRLYERLGEDSELARFLAVVGPSGAGKSSLVRAGLLPAVRRQALPGGKAPVLVDLTPGTHPFEELEAALLRVAANPPPSLMEQLRAGERGLARAVKRVLPGDDNSELLLVVDQFEELFTLVPDEHERAAFINSLFSAVTDSRGRLRVVITLRADFYDRPLLYLPATELLNRRSELVGPLSSDETYRAITGPAQRVGLELESDLIATIMQDIAEQPGVLPLLQYTLTELYERRVGRLMTLAAYQASGGVFGSLARRAESLYTGLTAADQEEARQLFLRLVTLGEGTEDTRRRVRMSELVSATRDEAALRRVLDSYGRYRMLTFDRDPLYREPTVEVAHEALLHSWGRLREWLAGSREALLVQRRLMSSAAEWQTAGREPSVLASGVRLAQFAALQEEEDGAGALALTAEEQAYLAASLDEQQREEAVERERQARELALQRRSTNRLRSLVAGLAVFLLVTAGLAGWALSQSQVAQANEQIARANLAHADALRLAAEANNLLQAHADANLIALLSIRSLNTLYSPQADAALAGVAVQGVPPRTFVGHSDQVFVVRFSPDGKYLATGSTDTTVRLWDIATGQTVHTFTGHTRDVDGLAFSPDGKYLISGSDDGTMRLWDLATYQPVRMFSGTNAPIEWIYFSPDGKYLLTDSQTPHIWDVASGQIVRTFTGHTDLAWPVFSPDAKYVFTASLDGTARLWDAATGGQIRLFAGPLNWCNAVAYSPDGRYVVAGCGDSSNQNLPASIIRMWNVATGEQVRQFTGAQGIYASAFSPDGRYLLTGGEGKVGQLWDVASGQQVRQFSGHADGLYSVAFSPDGQWIATSSKDRTARLWRLQPNPGALVLNGHTNNVWSATLSPDGKYILTSSDDNTARLWNAATGQELQRFQGHTGSVGSAVFAPDGKTILTASKDKTARLWDVATGRQVMTFTGHADGINRAFFSPDGKTVVTASDDKTARLWDVATGKELRRFTGNGDVVTKAVFSPDGKTVLTGGGDGSVRLWDTATGQQLRLITGDRGYVRASFSPDGQSIVTAGDDGLVRLLDVAGGQEVRRFAVPGVAMWDAEFSPDGKLILTGGNDGEARLWDTASGQEVRRLTGHTDGVRGVSFSSDGKYILTASLDKTARLWPTDYHDTIRALCGQLTRDLTPAERAQYNITDPAPTCPTP